MILVFLLAFFCFLSVSAIAGLALFGLLLYWRIGSFLEFVYTICVFIAVYAFFGVTPLFWPEFGFWFNAVLFFSSLICFWVTAFSVSYHGYRIRQIWREEDLPFVRSWPVRVSVGG